VAERLDPGASAPVVQTAGRNALGESESAQRRVPDEATRARFEQDLREVDQKALHDADSQVGEEGAVGPSYPGVATVMTLPVPAAIPGQTTASSPVMSARAQDSAYRRPAHAALIAVPAAHVGQDIRSLVMASVQGEGPVDGREAPARGGSDKVQAGIPDWKAMPVLAVAPASTSTSTAAAAAAADLIPTPVPIADIAKALPATLPPPAVRPDPAVTHEQDPAIASVAISDASFQADTQPVSLQTGDVASPGWGVLPAASSMPPGVMTQASEAGAPKVLPEQVIEQAVARLMVGVDRDGAKQVRVELRNEWMPGVRMVLQEAGGRVQIDLICSVEASRHRLSAISSREVGDIARRCKRDLLVRVRSEESADVEDSPDGHAVLGVA